MRRVFEMVVERCAGFGFIGGMDAAVDGSTIQADANRDKRACQEFRVWAGIMGMKESQYVTTERASDPQ